MVRFVESEIESVEVRRSKKGKRLVIKSVDIAEATLEAKGFYEIEEEPVLEEPLPEPEPDPLPDPAPAPPQLQFDAPRGQVIFEHHWAEGDVPIEYATPSAGPDAPRYAVGNKFRIVNPDGRLIVTTDEETGQSVLDMLVTAEDEARNGRHHTEIAVFIPDHWVDGRFLVPGQRYLLEWWRKNINYTPDTHWEIWSQNHSMYDSSLEAGRNPAVSIGIARGGNGNNTLTLRADPNATSSKDSRGSWSYTRQDMLDIGPPTSNVWELWQQEIVYHHEKGALHLWRNGNLVHSEEGAPVGYNDKKGPPWQFGWYKYFKDPATTQRQAYIGPVRVQKL